MCPPAFLARDWQERTSNGCIGASFPHVCLVSRGRSIGHCRKKLCSSRSMSAFRRVVDNGGTHVPAISSLATGKCSLQADPVARVCRKCSLRRWLCWRQRVARSAPRRIPQRTTAVAAMAPTETPRPPRAAVVRPQRPPPRCSRPERASWWPSMCKAPPWACSMRMAQSPRCPRPRSRHRHSSRPSSRRAPS